MEKFYTNPLVAAQCVKLIKQHVDINPSDILIEPSAGNGAFIPHLKSISKNCMFYDIKPEHPDIIKQNFFNLKNNFKSSIHIIGNPPFGRKMSSAIKFIKKCDQLNVKSISFILPRSFKKLSVKKSVPLHYHLKYQIELPHNSFIYHNKPFEIPTVFQIWIRKEKLRKKHTILYPTEYYKFTKNLNECHIAFRRVGYNTGVVNSCSSSLNSNTHYFIKVLYTGFDIDNIISRIKKIKINKKSNTGSISISKQFLIKKLNDIIVPAKYI
ncbi:hypothetical protein [Flavobacterium sp.]|uniref:hypothetical protein n=1 Tax=Flavobacterium sp. TaxID=239 RepID=UPI0037C0C701